MMNKKGQVLVVFVLLLPLIIVFLGLVIDIGNSLVTRKKYENTIKDVILYNYKEDEEPVEPVVVLTSEGNDLIEEEPEIHIKEVDLGKIKKNIEDSIEGIEEVKVEIKDNILIVNAKALYKSIFGSLFNIGLNNIEIEIKYNTETKRIVRE